jgi:hypothetical protein
VQRPWGLESEWEGEGGRSLQGLEFSVKEKGGHELICISDTSLLWEKH